MKKTASVCLLAASVVAVLFMYACKSVPSGELKASIQVTDVETKWVSKYYQPWPPRLILVPVVAFRVKNVGADAPRARQLQRHLQVQGRSREPGRQFPGRHPRQAGESGRDERGHHPEEQLRGRGQDGRLLQGQFPVEADGGQDLRPIEGLAVRPLGEWDISRTIDFAEPAPVDIKKEEPAKTR